MSDFERRSCRTGGQPVRCLWVEHRDKGRLELNFVVPNIELQSGKRLQPYFHKADNPRLDAWRTVVNGELKLHDPDDPLNRQAVITPKDLPRGTRRPLRPLQTGFYAWPEQGDPEPR